MQQTIEILRNVDADRRAAHAAAIHNANLLDDAIVRINEGAQKLDFVQRELMEKNQQIDQLRSATAGSTEVQSTMMEVLNMMTLLQNQLKIVDDLKSTVSKTFDELQSKNETISNLEQRVKVAESALAAQNVEKLKMAERSLHHYSSIEGDNEDGSVNQPSLLRTLLAHSNYGDLSDADVNALEAAFRILDKRPKAVAFLSVLMSGGGGVSNRSFDIVAGSASNRGMETGMHTAKPSVKGGNGGGNGGDPLPNQSSKEEAEAVSQAQSLLREMMNDVKAATNQATQKIVGQPQQPPQSQSQQHYFQPSFDAPRSNALSVGADFDRFRDPEAFRASQRIAQAADALTNDVYSTPITNQQYQPQQYQPQQYQPQQYQPQQYQPQPSQPQQYHQQRLVSAQSVQQIPVVQSRNGVNYLSTPHVLLTSSDDDRTYFGSRVLMTPGLATQNNTSVPTYYATPSFYAASQPASLQQRSSSPIRYEVGTTVRPTTATATTILSSSANLQARESTNLDSNRLVTVFPFRKTIQQSN